MIVKDEARIILECLQSVVDHIDGWVIVDTGSNDDTIQIIRDFFVTANIPGEVHQRSWVHFEHNRNEALALARSAGDYVLFMDADDVLQCPDDFIWPKDADAYAVVMHRGGSYYRNLRYVRATSTAFWKGVVHEAVHVDDAVDTVHLMPEECCIDSRHLGNRSHQADTFLRDAELLRAELLKDPSDTRNWFYLGQSLRDAGDYEAATAAYLERLKLGGWDEEIYCSLLELGRLQRRMGTPWPIAMNSLMSAYDYRPSRLEAIYEVVRELREQGKFSIAYALSVVPSSIEVTADWLFVEREVYDWRMLDERAICAGAIGQWEEAIGICRLLLDSGRLPDTERERVQKNLDVCGTNLLDD